EVDAAIDRLETYDFVVFTSANALRFFVERANERLSGQAVDVLGRRRLCLIGPATQPAASELGLNAFVVPQTSDASGLLGAVKQKLSETALAGKRFLIPRSDIARDVLPEGLIKTGAVVDSVETYKTIAPVITPDLLEELSRRHIDAIIFTSPSTVKNFFQIL